METNTSPPCAHCQRLQAQVDALQTRLEAALARQRGKRGQLPAILRHYRHQQGKSLEQLAAALTYPPDVTTDSHNQPLCGGISCSFVPLKLKGGGTWTYFRWGFSFNFGCGLKSDGSAFCVGGNGRD